MESTPPFALVACVFCLACVTPYVRYALHVPRHAFLMARISHGTHFSWHACFMARTSQTTHLALHTFVTPRTCHSTHLTLHAPATPRTCHTAHLSLHALTHHMLHCQPPIASCTTTQFLLYNHPTSVVQRPNSSCQHLHAWLFHRLHSPPQPQPARLCTCSCAEPAQSI